jgi:hypothetical protein
MSWKVVTLTANDVSAGKNMALQNAFAATWMAVGAPPDAAMYGDKNIRDGLYRFYFTPAAVMLTLDLLEKFGAVDCPEPEIHKLSVHVKNSGAGRTS